MQEVIAPSSRVPTAASTPGPSQAPVNEAFTKFVDDSTVLDVSETIKTYPEIDEQCVNSIRWLAAMMPFTAKCGHPGAPMGCAPIAHALWGYAMNYSNEDSLWWNRDRFVLSNGHACALQYTMLHLCGYKTYQDVSALKAFRQRNSATPGHPEAELEGVEVTTGPLGQGLANGVGLAIAQANLAAKYNKPEEEEFSRLFNSYCFVLCGDGCLQEGIASEAASLAGTMKLGNLIVLYDDNGITIDGKTDLSFTENVSDRFESYGWHCQYVADGDTDVQAILSAIIKAKRVTGQPSFIQVKTTIGLGSLLQGTQKVHGSALAEADMKQIRSKFFDQKILDNEDWWTVPAVATDFYTQIGKAKNAREQEWKAMFNKYCQAYPTESAQLKRMFSRELPDNIVEALPRFTEPDATRNLSEVLLNTVNSFLPELIGGSADLQESNKTSIKSWSNFNAQSNPAGDYLRFGVREHAMAAICNGLFAFGAHRPFGATFFNFLTYAWGAVRLSAVSHFGTLWIASHDSIELGEDGPTHQPIECIPLCRATPNMILQRPCDGNEVSAAYASWLKHSKTPTVLCLSRSKIPSVKATSVEGAMKGAYVLQSFSKNGKPKAILAASGTEVPVAMDTAAKLCEKYDCQVVSMPCWEIFEEQSEEYREDVLPRKTRSEKGIAVMGYMEASAMLGFCKYFDLEASHGMTTFGQSAPAKHNMEDFGFTSNAWFKKIMSI